MSEQQQAELDAFLRQAPVDFSLPVESLRAGFEEVMRHVPVADNIRKTPVTVGGVGALDVVVEGSMSTDVILYIHGGGYVIGSAESSMPLAAEFAQRTGAKVVVLDYRLAPENPFPAAVDDARAAYQALLSQGIEPKNIALAGESAGGGLAVAAALALRDAGVPLPASILAMSPWADLTLSGSTLVEKQPVDAVLTGDGLRRSTADYVGSADASDPYISPLFGNLHGLPPLLIQSGSREILLSDALRLASRAAIDDVRVTLDVVPGAPHVFQAYAAMLDEAEAALNRAADFLMEGWTTGDSRTHG
jgi:monoterpene epsilon-lactone hydrolase